MGKKKKEHQTFDRLADNRLRWNKRAYILQHDAKQIPISPRRRVHHQPNEPEEHDPKA